MKLSCILPIKSLVLIIVCLVILLFFIVPDFIDLVLVLFSILFS